MKIWTIAAVVSLLAACAGTPPQPSVADVDALFTDARFQRPADAVRASDVFALSPAMREYLEHDVARLARTQGSQRGLFSALTANGMLRLEYDGAITRNASQAFAARSGNCLSLVILTAAFAREMGIPVSYQNVFVDETWSRSGDFYLSIGHVNLTLGRRLVDRSSTDPTMTIDFLAPADIRSLRSWSIDESMIVAMYFNNRAVEALTAGNLDEAYWYARDAIGQDRRFLSAYNTLGVIYQRHRDLAEAEAAFRFVLAREPGNTRSLSNLAGVLVAQGRTAAARDAMDLLARLEPDPPFAYFKRGLAAMQAADYPLARAMFAKEVDRAAYYHEFHFWLAIAYLRLGDTANARAHLAIAEENSTTRGDHDLYAAKLAHLNEGPIVTDRMHFFRGR